MKKTNGSFLTVVAVFAAFIALAMVFTFGCQKSAEEQKPFNIAIASWVGFAPFYICSDKGFFKEEWFFNKTSPTHS